MNMEYERERKLFLDISRLWESQKANLVRGGNNMSEGLDDELEQVVSS